MKNKKLLKKKKREKGFQIIENKNKFKNFVFLNKIFNKIRRNRI